MSLKGKLKSKMWTVIKYKKKEINLLMDDLKKKLGDFPEIFVPKIKYKKKIKNRLHQIESDILDDYLLCYHKEFNNSKTITNLKGLKGLKYFLMQSKDNQKEIINFINYCKSNQGSDGYLKQSFFEFSNITKGIFLSGPFTSMIFKVIENRKNKLKILIGNITTTVTKNSKYLYRSI